MNNDVAINIWIFFYHKSTFAYASALWKVNSLFIAEVLPGATGRQCNLMAIRCRFNHYENLFSTVSGAAAVLLDAALSTLTWSITPCTKGLKCFARKAAFLISENKAINRPRLLSRCRRNEVSIATCTSSPNMQIQVSIKSIKAAKNKNKILKISVFRDNAIFFIKNKQLLSSIQSSLLYNFL